MQGVIGAGIIIRITLLFATLFIGACGGSGNAPSPSSSSANSASSPAGATYTVGSIIGGLTGSGLVLQNNARDDLSVTTNGLVTFSTELSSGSSYNITIKTQPTNPSQTCSLAGSTAGTITNANIVAVSVTCVTNLFTVGATVTGLVGPRLILQNNGGDDITVNANGVVTFPISIASGAHYAVTVKRQPIANTPASSSIQFCGVANGAGSVGNGPITVTVSCRPAVARFLYVPNKGDNTLSGFIVDAATGALTPVPGSPFHLDFPMKTTSGLLAIQPFGAALYIIHPTMTVGSTTSSGISAFSIDPVTGALTAMPGSPFATGATSSNNTAWLDPSGSFFYVFNSAESKAYIFKADQDTGILTPSSPLASTNVPFGPFFADARGVFDIESSAIPGLATVSVSNNLIDASTGEKIAISSLGTTLTGGPITSSFPTSISLLFDFNASRLYYSHSKFSSVACINVNPITGQLSIAANSPFDIGGITPTQLALHASGKFLYIIDQPGDTVNTFSINQTTGGLSAIGPSLSTVTTGGALTATTERGGYFLFPDNSAIGITRLGPTTPSSAGIYAINQSTGQLTSLPGSPFPVTGNTPETFFYEPSGKYAYLVDSGDNTMTAYSINTVTGARTFVGTYAVGSNPTISAVVVGRQ